MSTRDEQVERAVIDDARSRQLAQSIDEMRQRVESLAAAQRERFKRARTALHEHRDRLQADLAERDETLDRQTRDVDERLVRVEEREKKLRNQAEAIAEQSLLLQQLKHEFADGRAKWETLQANCARQQDELFAQLKDRLSQVERRREQLEHDAADLAQRQQKIAEQEAGLDRRDEELQGCEEQQQSDKADLAQRNRDLETRQAELFRERKELEAAQQRTRDQRRLVSKQLRSRRAEMLAEVERLREQVLTSTAADQAELQQQLARATAHGNRLQQNLDERTRQCTELTEQFNSLQEVHHRQTTENEQLKQHVYELTARLSELESGANEEAEPLELLRNERDMLMQQLSATETQLRERCELGDPAETADLRQRLEAGQEEIRELKTAKKSLQWQLEDLRTGKTAVAADSGKLDWESQKQKLLAQLESDWQEDDDPAEKLKAADVIRQTDRVLAEKQQEIDELRQILDEQSGNIGEVAVGAAAIAGILDQDEFIQQERETLRAMQEEWREKLRIAEVDISMERAKLARERAQIEERVQELERRMAQAATPDDKNGKTSKANRGRWRARLGLKDDE